MKVWREVDGGVREIGVDFICSKEGLGLVIRVFFISSLDLLFSKISCFFPTLETLAQLNNYENNIFIIIIFGPSCSQVCKIEASTSCLLIFILLMPNLKII